MRRVTAVDRDRAVRKLSLLTGGITACSVALVGGFGLLAKHETDHKNELKAQRSALAAAKGSSAQTALVGATAAQTRPLPTAQTTTTAGRVLAFSAPTTSSATSSASSTATATTAKRTTAKPVTKATVKPAVKKATTTSVTKAAPKVQAAVQQAPVQQAAVQQAPVQQAAVQQAPDPAPATQAPDPAPPPVQSSGS